MSSTLPIFEPKYTSIVLILPPLPVKNSVLRKGCPLSGQRMKLPLGNRATGYED